MFWFSSFGNRMNYLIYSIFPPVKTWWRILNFVRFLEKYKCFTFVDFFSLENQYGECVMKDLEMQGELIIWFICIWSWVQQFRTTIKYHWNFAACKNIFLRNYWREPWEEYKSDAWATKNAVHSDNKLV